MWHSADSQKMNLKWTSVGKAKCKEFHTKMKDFMLWDSANSQKMDLKWTSAWTAKCVEFCKKVKDFGGQWG